jgi:hypothetical protein
MVGTDRWAVHSFAAPAQIGCQFTVRSRGMLTEGNEGKEDFNLENVFVVLGFLLCNSPVAGRSQEIFTKGRTFGSQDPCVPR